MSALMPGTTGVLEGKRETHCPFRGAAPTPPCCPQRPQPARPGSAAAFSRRGPVEGVHSLPGRGNFQNVWAAPSRLLYAAAWKLPRCQP